MYCYVRDCPNGPKSLKKKKDYDLTKFFPAPEDKNLLEKWRRVIPKGENVLSPKDKLCDSHFLPSEVLWFTETKLPNGNVRRLLRDEPILRSGTIPSIFPAERLERETTPLPGKEKQETPKPIVKNVPSAFVKEKSATPKSIVKNTNVVFKEKIETPKTNFRIRFKDPIESSAKRNPQRVKRRSTILDDYWTDDELNQVHNPGVATRGAGGSSKKRKTESGLQPVIRLVPLECLMDKTASKSKTCRPVVGNRPSTEEIDHELKKVIEIPLLTSLKPKKSLLIRSNKDTVQFKSPKRNVSKSKMKMMADSEALVLHDEVEANPSEGFNEVKTETPDIEEELARMEMEEENEDVKSSDIIVMNPPLGEDDSVVVKSEEEDDGYSVNEVMEDPSLNIPEDEIPTIKSESEEEQPAVEVGSNSTSDNELAFDSQSTHVPDIEAASDSEQGSELQCVVEGSPIENSDGVLPMSEQPNEVEPEVPAEVEQNKDVEEHRVNGAELVENSTAVEAEVVDSTTSNERTEVQKSNESEEAKSTEEKSPEEEVLEDQEKEKTAESCQDNEADILIEAGREEVNTGKGQELLASDEVQPGEKDSQALQEVESERKDDESAMETEPSQGTEPERKEGESSMEIEKETLLPENIEETTKPVENKEIPESVDCEASLAAEEEMKETTEDGKDCGDTVEGLAAEMANTSEPSGAESENLREDKEILNEDESRSDNVNHDLPEAGDEADGGSMNEADGGSMNETDKGETGTAIPTIDGLSKPDNNFIDVSDSEDVEADKGPTGEVHQETDGLMIDVNPTEAVDQPSYNKDTPVEQSSSSQEVEPEKDDESAMEIEHGGDPGNVPSTEDIADDDTYLDPSPVAAGDEVAEAEKDNESEKRDSRQAEQPENDEEMDIEAEVARLVSEVEETAEESPNKKVENEGREGNASHSSQQKEKQSNKESSKEAGQPQEIVLQDTTNLGGITAAGVQNLFSPETIQEILKQIKLPLTTPVTFRIAPLANTPSSSSSGRGRGRKKGRGMRGTNRQVVPRASSSRDTSHNSIDLFRHLTRTRTVFDFPTFVSDIDDDIQYWKLCQILKESFHELIETRNTKTSIGKLTLRVAINRPKKSKVQQNYGESEADPQ